MLKKPYKLYIDTGGTFTDCMACLPTGKIIRKKILSNGSLRGQVKRVISPGIIEIDESWDINSDILVDYKFSLLSDPDNIMSIISYDWKKKIMHLSADITLSKTNNKSFQIFSGEEAPVMLARLVTGTKINLNLPHAEMRIGSTRGTNALLEKKGAEILLFVTKGFRDLLFIGNQQRPDIFSLNVEKPSPLCENIIEVDERINSKGEIVKPFDPNHIPEEINTYLEKGIEVAGIVLLNSFKNTRHETELQKILEESGFKYISISTGLGSKIKYLQRLETTVVNAYLSPAIGQYLDNISKIIGDNLLVMNSAGGLIKKSSFNPKDSLLSGPAGGVVGASSICKKAGINRFISFDMGGTSTDVSRYDLGFDYCTELKVGDAKINTLALSIETVAAGGGSICSFDGYSLRVGPESAGANPGPACYGAGGPLCITDINLLLGRLDTDRFGIPVFSESAESELNKLIESIQKTTGERRKKEEILTGFIQISNEHMAGAIKKISIAKGYDPSQFALVAFGGAGGLHACGIADMLKINKILFPSDAGLLSAYGIGRAKVEKFAEKQFLCPLKEKINKLPEIIHELGCEAIDSLLKDGFEAQKTGIQQSVISLRFKGQENSIEIPFVNTISLIDSYKEKYTKIFGHWSDSREIELESIRVVASFDNQEISEPLEKYHSYFPDYIRKIKSYIDEKWELIPVFLSDMLKPGAQISGPALILDKHSTCIVEKSWILNIDNFGTCILNRSQEEPKSKRLKKSWNKEIELEIFTNRFMSIAVHMGAMLERTSFSVNIKERLDYSCAILDPNGELVANAPHIPVHLGGLGICVRSLKKIISMEPGDTIITNHPAYGGSHLPDITLVTPVYKDNKQLLGYVVNRAHHAEIGGSRPASMPPDAKNLAEEGVVIFPFHFVKNGKVNWAKLKQILMSGPYPSRALEENLADLNAALAANRNGEGALLDLATEQGSEKVLLFMNYLKEHAENKMRETLNKIPEGIYSATEYLDDGSPLCVNISNSSSGCIIDFTGSSGVHKGNLNANVAVVHSVVIYVLRLLIAEKIPLNDGILKPVKIIIPEGILNPDFPDDISKCPAVVGGNVELSQRLTDTMLKAFGIIACSQGTMNNLLFGNEHYSYYETICGGCGAGEDFNGRSAVHHHMTNTRITDSEIMELRYPVLVESFEIRKKSGGKGKFYGGDGVIRKLIFTEDSSLSLLSQHRNYSPFGMKGGSDGKKGEQYIIRKNGEKIKIKGIDAVEVKEGDMFVIKTPGGGGFGKHGL
ncbi:hydantoinase B/oxoprolinase family protein [Bacteroidota bacterium]